MAKESDHSSISTDEKTLLFSSLEEFNKAQKQKRQSSIILAALCTLFMSCAGGISLAAVLLAFPIASVTCVSRDLILFAACLSIVYIGIHIRGAVKGYTRTDRGPPQLHGHDLHATAVLIARLSIIVWIASLIATAAIMATAVHLTGFAAKVPYLNLLICTGALPSFIIIASTIERNPTPFVTAGLSSSSVLTCRVSAFEEDLADLSVSRRTSLKRKQSSGDSAVSLTITPIHQPEQDTRTTQAFGISIPRSPTDDGEDAAKTELMANSPGRTKTHNPRGPRSLTGRVFGPRLPKIPPIPAIPSSFRTSPPQPTYNPGGWRDEWNNVAEKVGVPALTVTEFSPTLASSTTAPSSFVSSHYTSRSGISSHTSAPSSYTNPLRAHQITPSTSILSTTRRSNLSTVRYAEKPHVAVQPSLAVMDDKRKSLGATASATYTPACIVESDTESEGVTTPLQPPKPIFLLKRAQSAQRRVSGGGGGGLGGMCDVVRRASSRLKRPMSTAFGNVKGSIGGEDLRATMGYD